MSRAGRVRWRSRRRSSSPTSSRAPRRCPSPPIRRSMRSSAASAVPHNDVSTVRRAEGRRGLAGAGFAYVAAWVVGLLVAPSAPDPDASDATINAFYADHQSATLLQAALVHCVAGLALAGFVVSLARRVMPGRRDGNRTVFLVA